MIPTYLIAAVEECAARRFVISPAQPGWIGGMSLGPMSYLAPKG